MVNSYKKLYFDGSELSVVYCTLQTVSLSESDKKHTCEKLNVESKYNILVLKLCHKWYTSIDLNSHMHKCVNFNKQMV